MVDAPWFGHYTAELEHARQARQSGNEGMARVCARRAVGWVLGEYFTRHGIEFQNPSAYERIKFLIEMEDVSETVKDIAGHFTLRITADHALPIEADLIQDAQWLQKTLLESDTGSSLPEQCST